MAMRRSLVHVGGAVSSYGDPGAARILAHAIDVAPAERPPEGKRGGAALADDPDRAHVHGFHAYPARMHPVTASRLVEGFARARRERERERGGGGGGGRGGERAGDRERGGGGGRTVVLDPFCGSGTVLVEAMIAGRDAVGTDLNPLAVRLASLKTRAWTAEQLEALVREAEEVAHHADARRAARAGATARLPREDVAAFEPHVLLELDGLRDGIRKVTGDGMRDATGDATRDAARDATRDAARDALFLVLSAILVKLSRQRGDTDEPAPHAASRHARHAPGFAAKLFARKAEELARRLGDLASLLPSPRPEARVALEDATKLRTVRTASVDAIVSSPPYAGTYDYLAHHALRMRWLGLDAARLRDREMGARRRYAPLDAEKAREAWLAELRAMLAEMARVLRPGGAAVLVMADASLAGRLVRADEAVAHASQGTGLEPAARASQERPDFAPRRTHERDRSRGPARGPEQGRERREEHALYLVRR